VNRDCSHGAEGSKPGGHRENVESIARALILVLLLCFVFVRPSEPSLVKSPLLKMTQNRLGRHIVAMVYPVTLVADGVCVELIGETQSLVL
jgi:hypothetical protein